jgi:hypothetical protein
MEKILLNDILQIDTLILENTKIRLLTIPSNDKSNNPLEKYKSNPEEVATGWFLWKQKNQGKPFKKSQLGIGILDLNNDKWLLVTVKNIIEELNINDSGISYKAEEILKFKKYFGRIVLKYHNTSQQMCRNALGFIEQLEILEILSTPYEGDDFPGYENVTISWEKLKIIIDRQKKDWVSNFKNQKGIYLITDKMNGKHYVGSASGDEMILQRWSDYINNGHGGNIELKNIITEYGFEYIKKNFQYSILENFNKNTPIEYILEREKWWKIALGSIDHGYNRN